MANIPALVTYHFNSGLRGPGALGVMLRLCIIRYTFTNFKKSGHPGRSELAGSNVSSKERV